MVSYYNKVKIKKKGTRIRYQETGKGSRQIQSHVIRTKDWETRIRKTGTQKQGSKTRIDTRDPKKQRLGNPEQPTRTDKQRQTNNNHDSQTKKHRLGNEDQGTRAEIHKQSKKSKKH